MKQFSLIRIIKSRNLIINKTTSKTQQYKMIFLILFAIVAILS